MTDDDHMEVRDGNVASGLDKKRHIALSDMEYLLHWFNGKYIYITS